MSESSSNHNKVYTEATATISFKTSSREDAEDLMINFLSRRGLTQLGSPRYEVLNGKSTAYRARVTVSYRVHGGWKSDFIKKIESDARDSGIEIRDLDVIMDRKEIPDECPRSNCVPCGEAVRNLTRVRQKPVKDALPPIPEDNEFPTVAPEEKDIINKYIDRFRRRKNG